MHQNLVMQPMPGPPQGQPRLPNQQQFYPNQRSIRIPRHQPPNNQPMYSSPPEGPPMAVQMIGPPGTTQFMPPGQYPPFITQPVSVINVSYVYPYSQLQPSTNSWGIFFSQTEPEVIEVNALLNV